MAISYDLAIRNDRLNALAAEIDGGIAGGVITVYDGVRPATGGSSTTQLVAVGFSKPAFITPTIGVLVANAIGGAIADATGTATWFRVTDSNTNFIMDGDVGVTGSGSDMELNSINITLGDITVISSFIITAGND